jgi:predicted DNA-binding protein
MEELSNLQRLNNVNARLKRESNPDVLSIIELEKVKVMEDIYLA